MKIIFELQTSRDGSVAVVSDFEIRDNERFTQVHRRGLDDCYEQTVGALISGDKKGTIKNIPLNS